LATDGSRSDGLRTKVLPHAIAIGYIHIGTIAGKLNGVMPATTPSGWRSE
jgi:allophanate hydrolase subunit 1